jgi:hypothetical protein
VIETPTLQGKRIVPKFQVKDLKALSNKVKKIRDDFNWKANYLLVKRIFISETRGGTDLPKEKL